MGLVDVSPPPPLARAPIRPRAEAGILRWQQLTEAQKLASRQILGLLSGMAYLGPSGSRRRQQDLLRIDPQRYNRTLLIDGARGSGKTALMITLLDGLQRHYQSRVHGARNSDEAKDNLDKEIHAYLGGSLVLPVALIDLAPLPPNANLLLHFVSCLERAVAELEEGAGGAVPRSVAAWEVDSNDERQSRRCWHDLASAIVQGWDRQGGARSQPSDPETYARELMQAEKQRHDLTDCIDDFLDALHEDFADWLGRRDRSPAPNVLFLVAVDDSDMDPRRIPELLSALRLLGHRQLAFLLTGESRMFEVSLLPICLDDIVGRARSLPLQKEQQEAMWGLSSRLAAQLYDRLIPPSHRCELTPVPFAERLNVLVAREPGDSKPPPITLRQRLAGLPDGTPSRLLGYFEHLPWLARALPTQLRQLVNLGQLIAQPDKSEQRETRVVEFLWQHAARDAGLLDPDKELGMVRLRGGSQGRLVVVAREASEGASLIAETWATLPAQRAAPDSEYPAVQAALSRVELREPSALLPADERTAAIAALLLAGLLAVDHGGVAQSAYIATKTTGYEPLLAHATLQLPMRSARLERTAERVTVAWPLPTGLPLLEQTLLAHRWAEKLKSLVGPATATAAVGLQHRVEDDGAVALAFLALVLAQADRLLPGLALLPEASGSEPAPLTRMGTALARLAWLPTEECPAPVEALCDWARSRAGLLAAPESGLSPTVANRLLIALRWAHDPERWPQVRAELKQARHQRLQAGLGGTGAGSTVVAGIIQQADHAFVEHDWAIAIEEGEGVALAGLLSKAGFRLSPYTRDLLGGASPALVRRLRSGFPGRPTETNCRAVLSFLWTETGKQESHSVELSQAALAWAAHLGELLRQKEAQSPVLSSLRTGRSLLESPAEPLWLRGSSFPVTVGKARALTLEIDDRADSAGASALRIGPLYRGLLQLQWDHLPHDGGSHQLPDSPFWDAVLVQVERLGQRFEVPWPSVSWDSTWADGLVAWHWNRALEDAPARILEYSEERFLEALAYFYLELCFSVPLAGAAMPAMPKRPLGELDWHLLLDNAYVRTYTPQPDRHGVVAERSALEKFWQRLPWLAAPECGLPVPAVRAILKWLIGDETRKRLLRNAADQRQVLWLQSVRRAGAKETEQDELVEKLGRIVVDRARRDEHPFQVLLDSWKVP